ncbi:MAG: SAM-dependent methyltransferase [Actinomycetota bacterium]|nr:SAM-dependent methyltransferase [Actinomycetota bacterium]
MEHDWVEWHRRYDDPTSTLSARLAVVVDRLRAAFDAAPPGPIRVVSLCAGEARDVCGAVADHARRVDVEAWLVEADPMLATRAAERAAAIGLAGRVAVGDAGSLATFADAPRADVLLLCGIFGNVAEDDIRTTIDATPMLCASPATVIWTRHRRHPDLTPAIRAWFTDAGCEPVAFVSPGPNEFAVGVERHRGPKLVRAHDGRLFRFRAPA